MSMIGRRLAMFAFATLAASATTTAPAQTSPTASALEPQAVDQRARDPGGVNAAYRRVPSRLVVREAIPRAICCVAGRRLPPCAARPSSSLSGRSWRPRRPSSSSRFRQRSRSGSSSSGTTSSRASTHPPCSTSWSRTPRFPTRRSGSSVRLTRPHLFVPLPILPAPRDTIYVVPFAAP